MTERVTLPSEPTLEMCDAYLIATGTAPRYRKQWMEYLRKNIGTSHECSFVVGLRAAIAVGAGLPLDRVKRGFPRGSA